MRGGSPGCGLASSEAQPSDRAALALGCGLQVPRSHGERRVSEHLAEALQVRSPAKDRSRERPSQTMKGVRSIIVDTSGLKESSRFGAQMTPAPLLTR